MRSDEDGEDVLEHEGVQVIMVGELGELGSKPVVCKKRLKSEKGRGGGWSGLDEAGERTRLDFGVVLDSSDSKRVTSLDTAILRGAIWGVTTTQN